MSANELTRVMMEGAAPVVSQGSGEDRSLVLEQVSTAVATGVVNGLMQVLQSKELGHVIETVSKGNAISGMMSALLQSAGRKGLDASLMDQNALEIVHFIEKTFDKFKERAQSVSTGETSRDVFDGEKDFKKWVELE